VVRNGDLHIRRWVMVGVTPILERCLRWYWVDSLTCI
jgi:hypothetical protein